MRNLHCSLCCSSRFLRLLSMVATIRLSGLRATAAVTKRIGELGKRADICALIPCQFVNLRTIALVSHFRLEVIQASCLLEQSIRF